jgi:hypothetical protein
MCDGTRRQKENHLQMNESIDRLIKMSEKLPMYQGGLYFVNWQNKMHCQTRSSSGMTSCNLVDANLFDESVASIFRV